VIINFRVAIIWKYGECIPVHCPVLARCLIWYPAKSVFSHIPRDAIWCIASIFTMQCCASTIYTIVMCVCVRVCLCVGDEEQRRVSNLDPVFPRRLHFLAVIPRLVQSLAPSANGYGCGQEGPCLPLRYVYLTVRVREHRHRCRPGRLSVEGRRLIAPLWQRASSDLRLAHLSRLQQCRFFWGGPWSMPPLPEHKKWTKMAHFEPFFNFWGGDSTLPRPLPTAPPVPQTFRIWCSSPFTHTHTHTTHTHTTVLRLSGFCPGQPGWVSTRRNIHPITPIVVISHPLSASSIYYDPWHPLL